MKSYQLVRSRKEQKSRKTTAKEMQTHLKELNLPGWPMAISRPSAALGIVCLQLRIICLQAELRELRPTGSTQHSFRGHSRSPLLQLPPSGDSPSASCLLPAQLPTTHTFITLATEISVLALLF